MRRRRWRSLVSLLVVVACYVRARAMNDDEALTLERGVSMHALRHHQARLLLLHENGSNAGTVLQYASAMCWPSVAVVVI